jgi:hypothetical protein
MIRNRILKNFLLGTENEKSKVLKIKKTFKILD